MDRDSESESGQRGISTEERRGTERKHLQRPGERNAKNQKEENIENETGRETRRKGETELHRDRDREEEEEIQGDRLGVRGRDTPRPRRGGGPQEE